MIRGEAREIEEIAAETSTERKASPGVVWEKWNVPREEREARNGHKAAVLWFTGLSGSGKSTIARAVERVLFDMGCQTMLLDGDQLRHGLNGDLGFSPTDRTENIRRAGEVAQLFFQQGAMVLCTFVSPYRADRERVRELMPDGRFIEVFVDCDAEECARRDPKGLYNKAKAGEITNMTAVSAPYEAPANAELHLDTTQTSSDDAVKAVIAELKQRALIK
jgi:bifunctional enzyme CysN/CysC